MKRLSYHSVVIGLSLVLMGILQGPAFGQFYMGPSFSATHYTYNGMGGPAFTFQMGKTIDAKSTLLLEGGIHYAIGNRGFQKTPGEKYSILDGAAVHEYPFTDPHPGNDPEWYVIISKLKVAQTVDIGCSLLYLHTLHQGKFTTFQAGVGVNLAWMEDSYIPYTFKVDLRNIFILIEDLNLVAPFNDRFFTYGPVWRSQVRFKMTDVLHLTLHAGASHLRNAGVKFTAGPAFNITLR